MSDPALSFRRPPTVGTVMKWVGRLARHEHFGERLTGEEAHRAAAVFFATHHALRIDVLGPSWKGQRHIAAKCGELFERVSNDPTFRQSNIVFEVDILFRKEAA